MKKYYCKCEKEISYWGFKYGSGLCRSCATKKQIGGSLEVHHKKDFTDLLTEFLKEYDQFSPIEDKETLVRLS